MTSTRQEWEAHEIRCLAPYAVFSAQTRGRVHAEREHIYRSCYQRDRDRVIHSRSFRRLEYKTQVFVDGTADHYRTRLTHTMEMAAVGRTLARVFRVSEDLTEAICLAHDVGHSCFGHVGEDTLNELMAEEGGFDHNRQALRAVERLEYRYPGFTGLNLTWEVRAGLLKHEAHKPGAELDGVPVGPFQFIEAQLADAADDITYHAHDVDDGLESGLITEMQLHGLAFWRKANERAQEQYTALSADQQLQIAIRNLLDLQMFDLIQTSSARLRKYDPADMRGVMDTPEKIAGFSPEMTAMLKEFYDFMLANLYYHPGVTEMHCRGAEKMKRLFAHYIEHPETLGRKARERIGEEGLLRTVCDYVAGCTDRYALEEYHRFNLDKV